MIKNYIQLNNGIRVVDDYNNEAKIDNFKGDPEKILNQENVVEGLRKLASSNDKELKNVFKVLASISTRIAPVIALDIIIFFCMFVFTGVLINVSIFMFLISLPILYVNIDKYIKCNKLKNILENLKNIYESKLYEEELKLIRYRYEDNKKEKKYDGKIIKLNKNKDYFKKLRSELLEYYTYQEKLKKEIYKEKIK